MKRVINRKGYVTLEAAIFLPVFVLAVVSLVYYINIFSVQENVYYDTFEESARLASKASVVKYAPGFTTELKSRVCDENQVITDLDVSRFRYLYWDGDLDNMIAVDIDCAVELELPIGFGHTYPIKTSVKCRGFTGLRKTGTPMSFDEMESEGSWDPVWVFPMSGEKYHGANCTYVKANAKEMVLTRELMKKYEPCSLCEAENLPTGALVYCFYENGVVYHRDTCRQVDRYAMEMNKQDAVNKGYTPCSKCGGG